MLQPDQPNQSFWKDDPEVQLFSARQLGFFKTLVLAYSFFLLVSAFATFYLLDPVFAWFWLAFFLISIGAGIFARKRRKLEIQNIIEIQQRASKLTGASLIGSAIHVAGHPQLDRDQNIVLALIAPNLVVYSYKTDQPLVTIPIPQIASIQTVVYDDDRIPHVDVVDSTAQAIQLKLNYERHEIVCLFRGMKKVRPIDWYHAIQKSRVLGINHVA